MNPTNFHAVWFDDDGTKHVGALPPMPRSTGARLLSVPGTARLVAATVDSPRLPTMAQMTAAEVEEFAATFAIL